MVEEEVRGTFSGYPEVIYGFTDIAYSALAGAYESALVFAVPYGERLTVETYSEEKFEKGIQGAKKKVEEILAQLRKVLDERGVKYYVPPAAQKDEASLLRSMPDWVGLGKMMSLLQGSTGQGLGCRQS